jgi:CRP/FNR family transcriptional regulator, anaerobic regulatory protein
MIHRHFRKNEKIWDEGDDTSYFAIIVSGAVKLVKLLPDGRQQIIGMLFASDFVGNLFSDKRTSFAEAATDTELCCFPRKEFERAMCDNPGIEHALLERTFQNLTQAREWLVTLGRKKATEKIATFLISLIDQTKKMHCENLPVASAKVVIELPLNRSEIADYLSLTIETVSRHFTKLKKAGIIDFDLPQRIVVLDPDRLCKLAGR